MSALRFIHETLITATATATVNLTDVFSNDFDTYLIQGQDVQFDYAGDTYLHSRFINSTGGVITTTNYDYATNYVASSTGGLAAEQSSSDNAAESCGFVGQGSGDSLNFEFYVFNPTNTSMFTLANLTSSSHRASSGISYFWQGTIGLETLDDVRGIQFYARSGNIDYGRFKVYGIRRDV